MTPEIWRSKRYPRRRRTVIAVDGQFVVCALTCCGPACAVSRYRKKEFCAFYEREEATR
jgi:hypothetical protein